MENLPKRLAQQLKFVMEIDKLKNIYRQNLIADASRQENDAEHSWHLAVLAVLLAEYVPEPVDLLKVMKMVLLHDVVEIDAEMSSATILKPRWARRSEKSRRRSAFTACSQLIRAGTAGTLGRV